jgi:hypothetical protein
MSQDPHLLDPDYDKHGGFPNFQRAEPGPGFGRFLAAMRRAQDLAVSADPDAGTWDQAADRAPATRKNWSSCWTRSKPPKASVRRTAFRRCPDPAAC